MNEHWEQFDSPKLRGLRKKLVAEVSSKGKFNPEILAALAAIPRHLFVNSAFAEQAYEDKAFPIGKDQTISQPYTVVYQTQLLGVQKGQKVLEIGTGSGYQASILAYLGALVYSIERVPELYKSAIKILNQLGLRVKTFEADGTLGFERYAPYDRILVTAAAPTIPEALLYQLKPNGILVIPVGNMESQVMERVTRTGEHSFNRESFDAFKFVPLIGKEGW